MSFALDIQKQPHSMLSPHSFWSMTFEFQDAAGIVCYTAKFSSFKNGHLLALIGEKSYFAERALLQHQLRFMGLADNGEQLSGEALISVVGKVDEVLSRSDSLSSFVAPLKAQMPFAHRHLVVVQAQVVDVEHLGLYRSAGINWMT